MIPGEMILRTEEIACNKGQKTVTLDVTNKGDRPIQVSSHYHFFEVNRKLDFDRAKALGMRLNILSSTAVRFEPGEKKRVVLVEVGGKKKLIGFAGLTNGEFSGDKRKDVLNKARKEGFMK